MATLAPAFLIGSSSLFQVTRNKSLDRVRILGQIGPRAVELATLGRIDKIPIDL